MSETSIRSSRRHIELQSKGETGGQEAIARRGKMVSFANSHLVSDKHK